MTAHEGSWVCRVEHTFVANDTIDVGFSPEARLAVDAGIPATERLPLYSAARSTSVCRFVSGCDSVVK